MLLQELEGLEGTVVFLKGPLTNDLGVYLRPAKDHGEIVVTYRDGGDTVWETIPVGYCRITKALVLKIPRFVYSQTGLEERKKTSEIDANDGLMGECDKILREHKL